MSIVYTSKPHGFLTQTNTLVIDVAYDSETVRCTQREGARYAHHLVVMAELIESGHLASCTTTA